MQYSSNSSGGAGIAWLIFALVVYLVGALPLMGVFGKARQPGWAAFIPIYNLYVLLKTVGRPGWWLILYLIPIVNLVITIIVWNDLSTAFGHGAGFTIGLFFLSWIFLLILWLGSSTYSGPVIAGRS